MPAERRSRVRMHLDQLELAKGHDGLLRGRPEPVLIIGVYLVEPARARLVARELIKFQVRRSFPCTIKQYRSLLAERAYEHAALAHFVVLAMAVEEDSGRDVQHVYAILDRVSTLTVWSPEAPMPMPMHMDELPLDDRSWWSPYRVHVMVDGALLGETCRDDDWVDASLLVVPTAHAHARVHRMHFLSQDHLNDWTAEVRVVLS